MVLSEGTTEKKNLVTLVGIDPGTIRLVAQRLNHYATPGPTDIQSMLTNRLDLAVQCRLTYISLIYQQLTANNPP